MSKKQQIRAINRLTGDTVIARRRTTPTIRRRKKPTTNYKKLNRSA